MFNTLFIRYKRTILRKYYQNNIKGLDKVIVFYVIVMMFMAIVAFFGIVMSLVEDFQYARETLLIISIICFILIVLIIFRTKKLESQNNYIVEQEKIAHSNMRIFVEFLVDNNISVKDLSSLDSLISLANEKKEMTKESKDILSALIGSFKYFVIPVITIVIKDYLDIDDISELIVRIILASIVPMLVSFIIVFVAVNLKSILETEKEKIGFLISDLTEVKCFNETAIKMEEEYNKKKSILVTQ